MPVERYRLDGIWSLHLYRYEAELKVGAHSMPIRPGFAGITPPSTNLEYRFSGPSVHAYAHFTLPNPPNTASRIPAMQDCGSSFGGLNSALEEAMGYWPTNRRRAEARVWDILWSLAEAQSADAQSPPMVHPAVQGALHAIELRLGEPLSVADLARDAGISHNHLTRLFHAAMGETVIGYIQQRRIERARHLLSNSTLPIKAIAAQVGIPDLHLFNKTVRRALGDAPRRLRNG